MTTQTQDSTGRTIAIGAAAGIAAGLVANLLRKSAVQAPTVVAGQWDQALAAEHKAVLAIIGKAARTKDTQTGLRSFLLMQIKHALGKHSFAEENSIYAKMRDLGMPEGADHLNHEHGYIKQALFDLTEMDKGDAGWATRMRHLETLVSEHAGEEERDLFPKLKAKLTAAENKHLTTAMNKEAFKLA